MSIYPKRTALDAGVNTYWRKKVFEYDAESNLVYFGTHKEADASDDDTSHVVHKFTADAEGNITKIQTLPGSWAGRAGLAW